MSLVGPGRDDVTVRLADASGTLMEARTYASQGDQRTAALALKLAEHDLLSEVLEDKPILLLDDVFSELDPRRRDWLREAVPRCGPDAAVVGGHRCVGGTGSRARSSRWSRGR